MTTTRAKCKRSAPTQHNTAYIRELIQLCTDMRVVTFSCAEFSFTLSAAPVVKPAQQQIQEPAQLYDPNKNHDGNIYGVDDDTLYMSSGG